MIEGPKFSLVNLEGLSEPATKLVEVVSAAIGTIYAPFGTVRQAKADARATIIRANADAEAASLAERASSRIAYREAVRQQNIEKIVSLAVQELPERVSDKPVDPDWMFQYLDQAQDVSDDEMQTLWARILAGEVAAPGSYAKRTLAFLSTLEKWEAENFTEFCSFALLDLNAWSFVIHCDAYHKWRQQKFGARDVEGHFTSIGLLQTEPYLRDPSSLNGFRFSYFGEQYQIVGPQPQQTGTIADLEIPVAARQFSMIGQQLANIAGATAIPHYVEDLSESLENLTIEPVSTTRDG